MSSTVLSWAMNAPVSTPAERLVFMMLADNAHEFECGHNIKNEVAFSEKCVLPLSGVIENLLSLQSRGYITFTYNIYHLVYTVHNPEDATYSCAPQKYDDNKRQQIGRKQSRRIMERDSYRCVYCGAAKALCIDHIIPFSKGGSNDDDNLQTCCRSCNGQKGSKSHEEFVALRVTMAVA